MAPLLLGVLAIVPWYFGAFAAACAAIVAREDSGHSSVDKSPPSRSPRVTAACFNLFVLSLYYFIFLIWQHVESHGIRIPKSFANIVAGLECAVDSPNSPLQLGSMSFGGCGNSFAISTRGEMTALIGSAVNPHCFVLTTDQLHLLLFAFLLSGSVMRSWLLVSKGKVSSVISDLFATGTALLLYLIVTWWDVLADQLDSQLWPYRNLSLIYIVAVWLAIRTLLCVALDKSNSSDNPIDFRVPPLLSLSTFTSILILICGVLFSWHDPGEQKLGRILIDEGHSDWEKSDLPMETEHYGVKTVYNYAFLKEILEKHYTSVTNNHAPISSQLLSSCDVLILKTPTKSYQSDELKSIHDFVSNGGGVWLVGDHTNIFGMNTYLNQVSMEWELRFNADALVPLHNFYQDFVRLPNVANYPDCGIRKHENLYSRRYLNHPIVGHNIPYLAVLTSCSLSAPLFCEYVDIAHGMFVDKARFGGNTFFGNFEHDEDERYGSMLQAVAIKVDRGRVFAWADSTLFSNFSMCMTGVPQLAMGAVNWLNRRNTVSGGTYVTIQVILVCFVGLIALILPATRFVYACCSGFILFGCFVPLVDYFNSSSYAIGDITTGFRSIGFDQQYSQTELPNKDHVHQNDDRRVLESFYVQMQRMHFMPVSADRIRDLLKCNVIVLFNPASEVDHADVARLHDFTVNGGCLLLMVGSIQLSGDSNDASIAYMNQLLQDLEVPDSFSATPPITTDLYGSLMEPYLFTDIDVSADIRRADDNTITLLTSAEGRGVMTLRPYGNGKIGLCSVAEIYTNPFLGEPGTVPDRRQALILRSSIELITRMTGRLQDDQKLQEPWKRLLSTTPANPKLQSRPDAQDGSSGD